MERSLYTRAILIGGIFSGVISGIPLFGLATNCCCCCIWYIFGGLIAAYVIVYYSPVYAGDGAGTLAGLGAGALGGIINSIMSMFFQLVSPSSQINIQALEPFMKELPPGFQENFMEGLNQGAALSSLIAGMLILIVVACAVSTFGGFLGMRIFRPLRMMAPAAWPPGQYWPPQGPGPGHGGYPHVPPGGMAPPPGGWQAPPPESGGPSSARQGGSTPAAPGRQSHPPQTSESGQHEQQKERTEPEDKKKGPGGEGPSGNSTPPEWGGF